MAKLANIFKQLNETKNLLLQQYEKNEKLRESNERLRQLNSKLSKEVKDLRELNMKLLDEKNKK